jgi:shikimate dehydrogenase
VTLRRALPGRVVLLGHPVAHSLSPRFQNAALREARIAARYEAIDVPPDALPAALDALVAEGAAGNVTVPHKLAVAARCAHRTAIAERAGAVNTFWVEDGRLVGDNTDVAGVDAAVARLLGRAPAAERVALLGGGGSAAAVLCAVEGWGGASAAVYNRTMPHAHALAARFPGVAVAATPGAALADATLVVNATPVGLDGSSLPVAIEALPPGVPVLDLVSAPGETAWVHAARAAGHPAQDGLVMLVEQGAAAFERWFGVPPSRAAMWAALR